MTSSKDQGKDNVWGTVNLHSTDGFEFPPPMQWAMSWESLLNLGNVDIFLIDPSAQLRLIKI